MTKTVVSFRSGVHIVRFSSFLKSHHTDGIVRISRNGIDRMLNAMKFFA